MGVEPAGPVAAPEPAGLDWQECPELGAPYDGMPTAAFLECATVEVPLDYTEPNGETIEIAVSRLPSQDPTQRRGALLLNPGGPGGPGLPMPLDLAALGAPASLLDSYDLIGFDPRGVGYSAPVDCGIDLAEYNTNIPPYATSPKDVKDRASFVEGIAEMCADADTDGSLKHMSTANTARDMDQIRDALGEETISYFGVSYGTALGSAYVSMFPENTDRVLLDSATARPALDRAAMRRMGRGTEDRFPDFTEWAAQRDGTYELGATSEEVRAKYFELAERLDEEPLPGFDGAFFRLNTFSALYDDASFPELAQLWQSVDRLDASRAEQLAQHLSGPPPGAAYSPAQTVSAQLAVICNDTGFSSRLGTYQRDVIIDRGRYPVFGAATAGITPCAYWPNEPVERPVDLNPEGPELVILQNLRDPATPYSGAAIMAQRFGERANFVSVDQGGHGAYLFNDNACANNIATRYLVHGELPGTTSCGPAEAAATELTEEERELREEAKQAMWKRTRPLF